MPNVFSMFYKIMHSKIHGPHEQWDFSCSIDY